MSYLPGLVLALGAMWFAFSFQTSPQFLVLAGVAVLLSIWIAARFRIIGRDSSPYHRAPQMAVYVGWLLVEIVKSNLAVIARVLGPRDRIDPAMVSLRTTAKTDLGKALFANSITLTPGTVTVEVDGDRLKVHVLSRETSTVSSFEAMDSRAARAADGSEQER